MTFELKVPAYGSASTASIGANACPQGHQLTSDLGGVHLLLQLMDPTLLVLDPVHQLLLGPCHQFLPTQEP